MAGANMKSPNLDFEGHLFGSYESLTQPPGQPLPLHFLSGAMEGGGLGAVEGLVWVVAALNS